MNDLAKEIPKEKFEQVIRQQVATEKLFYYAESLKIPASDLQNWVKSCPVPKIEYAYAHDWQRKISYPMEGHDLEKFKSAIYYLYFAGNKGGKTVWGTNWVAMECLGIHPLQDIKVRPLPPVHWWVVSPNLPSESEVPRGEDAAILKKFYDWLPDMQRDGTDWGIKKFYRKDKLMTIRDKDGHDSVVNFKSHDQEKGKFKSEDVDGIYWDEEPPKNLWDEGIPRILTKKGIFILAMTPDYGSWTFTLLKNKTNPQYYIVEMDSLENPFMPAAYRKQVIDTMSEDQQMMRRMGVHIQFKGKVFPFSYDKNVGKPFVPSKDTTQFVIIDWHPAKPIMISYLAINASGIWYVFRESVIDDHVVEKVAREYFQKLTFPDYKLQVKKVIIDKIAQIQQVQDGAFRPKSVVDMLRGFDIRCEVGRDDFEAAQTFLSRKLKYQELWFDSSCTKHIEQWDTWGAKRYLHGNLEGTLRDQLEGEGNDMCMNLVYAYNSGAKWYTNENTEMDVPFRPRSSTSRIYGRNYAQR